MSDEIKTVMVRDERGRWVIPVQPERDDLPRSFRRGAPILDEYGDTVSYEQHLAPTRIDLAVVDWPDHITGPIPITLQKGVGNSWQYGIWTVFYNGERFGKVRGK